MTASKKLSKRASKTLIDLRLKEYISLGEKIGKLEKLKDQIRKELLHCGSITGREYVALVTEKSRTNCSTKAMLKAFGPKAADYFTVSTYKELKVSKLNDD